MLICIQLYRIFQQHGWSENKNEKKTLFCFFDISDFKNEKKNYVNFENDLNLSRRYNA